MKKLITKIWDAVKGLYDDLRGKTREVVPVAIKIVEGVKSAMETPVDDIVLHIVKTAIPGEADDIIIDKVKSFVEEWVPKVLANLNLIDSISGIESRPEQLKAILEQFRLSPDEVKNIAYHGLASLAIEKLSDGKLSWSDSVALSEYYFKNFAKK